MGEVKSRPADRLVPALLALGALLTTVDIVWTFTLAPLVQGAQLSQSTVIAGTEVSTKLLLSQKIFYLHVPVAIASFAVMAFAAYYGLRFLMTKDRIFDTRSRTAMQVTLVFVLATMISRSVDALRVGRLVGLGAAPDHLLHPHAARYRVLHPA